MKTFDEVYQALMPELERVEAFRQELRKKSKNTVFVGIGICLVAIIVGLIISNYAVIGIGVLIGVIVIAVGFFSFKSKYTKEFKGKIIPTLLKGVNETMIYKPKGYIDKTRFKKGGIFQQSIDKYSGED